MKTFKNLWPKVVSFENLLLAAGKAQTGKLSKPEVSDFNLNLEKELWRIKEQLEAGEYAPGPYRVFRITEPKPRVVSAAPFRDRVVHHALCNVIEPVFDRRFIYDSYANRVGKGSHSGLKRFTRFLRRNEYVLKCDIEKFFPSVDHAILLAKLGRVVACPDTMKLIRLIVDSSPEEACVVDEHGLRYFPGDDLFTPLERRRALPIGNLTSQLFANVYLDGLDHFVKEQLRVKDYVRYLDDFAIFGRSKSQLREIREGIRDFLAKDRLKLHNVKTRVFRTGEGVEFLGFRVFRDRIRIKKSVVARFKKGMRQYADQYKRGEIPLEKIRQSIASWRGHARQGDTDRLMRILLRHMTFVRGPATGGTACLSSRASPQGHTGCKQPVPPNSFVS